MVNHLAFGTNVRSEVGYCDEKKDNLRRTNSTAPAGHQMVVRWQVETTHGVILEGACHCGFSRPHLGRLGHDRDLVGHVRLFHRFVRDGQRSSGHRTPPVQLGIRRRFRRLVSGCHPRHLHRAQAHPPQQSMSQTGSRRFALPPIRRGCGLEEKEKPLVQCQ